MRTALLLLVPALLTAARTNPAAAQSLASLTDADISHGRALYEGRCARCHGVQGGGGEGPVLARAFLTFARDDATLVQVIQSGIPNTAMQGDWTLGDIEARQLAGYVRALGRVAVSAAPVKGDATRGERLFRERGGCIACHGINGIGGPLGPSLTQVGGRRNADYIRQSIVDPAAALPLGSGFHPSGFHEYVPVDVSTKAGDAPVRGHRVNESSFVILVRDEKGVVRSFDKTQLAQLVKRFGQSLMPSYRNTFTDAEVDDLVAYLLGLREFRP